MEDFFLLVQNNLLEIISAFVTGLIGYISLKMRSMFKEYINLKEKKEIVEKTVMYIEQTEKNLSCEEKKKKALEKSRLWLKEKKINISDTELEVLIESSVNCL